MAHHNPHYDGPDHPYNNFADDDIHDHITKLHLEPGDILVVTDIDIAHDVVALQMCLTFPVPILVVPPGGVEKYSRRDLLSMLAMLPEEPADA